MRALRLQLYPGAHTYPMHGFRFHVTRQSAFHVQANVTRRLSCTVHTPTAVAPRLHFQFLYSESCDMRYAIANCQLTILKQKQ